MTKLTQQLPSNARFEIIEVKDARAGDFRIREVAMNAPMDYDPFEFLEVKGKNDRVLRQMSLKEALIQNPDARNLLRDGIRTVAFNQYAGLPVTYSSFAKTEQSNKPEEYWLRDGTLGRIPRSPSGSPVPRLTRRLEGSSIIQNFRYAGIIEVLGDDIRFDRLGIIRQTAESMGRAGRFTEEAEVYNFIANTANYTRAQTTGDNDSTTGNGANTQALDLTQANFEAAMNIIATMKDRTSGMYLGLMPNMAIVGPLMKFPLMKLLNSGGITAAGTAGSVTQVGDLNVYRGAIDTIIVSPFLTTSYDWIIADNRVPGLQFQTVEPFNVYQATPTPDNNDWLQRDVIDFLVSGYFGVGFVDDRAWAYFTSTTRPTL